MVNHNIPEKWSWNFFELMDYDIDGLLTKYGGRIMEKSNKGNEDYIEENQKLYMEGVINHMIDI